MKPGLFMPEATTSWSRRPNRLSAASTMALASASVSGRRTTASTSPPTSRTSAATASSSSLVPEASTSLPPSAPSAMAQPRPNAPDAPVTIATLPLLSNSDSGLRSCSEIMADASVLPRSRCPFARALSPFVPAQAGTQGYACRSLDRRLGPRFRGDERRDHEELSSSLPRFEPERLLRVEHRHHPQRAALPVRPAPREREERAALAGDLVDVAADVLDARDAVGHHDLVRRLPIREVLGDVAAGRGLVLVVEMRLRRPRSVRAKERAERGIERLHVDADELDATFDDPLRRLLVETGGMGEV